jgi:hypothetical protein
LLLAAAPLGASDIDPQTRIDGLEARLEGLTRRVQALETLIKESGPGSGIIADPKGEPTWELDDYSRSNPFQVILRSLDRESGRVDLLLTVVATIPDLAVWAAVPRGGMVPLLLTAELAGDGPAAPLALHLERATRWDPGARIHLKAQLDPGLAKRVRQVRIEHATPPGLKTRGEVPTRP